jgi:hypothetical protein
MITSLLDAEMTTVGTTNTIKISDTPGKIMGTANDIGDFVRRL